MSKQTPKPKFNAEGYQTNMKDLNGEPLPDPNSLSVLSREEEALLGLPSPEELAGTQPKTKISLAIDDDALAFFKAEAKKHKTSYQRMIRNLIRAYVQANRQSTRTAKKSAEIR
ncbi:MAG: BrnA antitoxin family protein [Chthoniobacteraceae bacterium]